MSKRTRVKEQIFNSYCGLVQFEKTEQRKSVYQARQNHVIPLEELQKRKFDFEQNMTKLTTKYDIDESSFDSTLEYKSALFDLYDDDIILRNIGCTFCGLISRTIWLLTVNERMPYYCRKEIIEKEQCPFGTFCGKNLASIEKEGHFDFSGFNENLLISEYHAKFENKQIGDKWQHIHTVEADKGVIQTCIDFSCAKCKLINCTCQKKVKRRQSMYKKKRINLKKATEQERLEYEYNQLLAIQGPKKPQTNYFDQEIRYIKENSLVSVVYH